jgi:hypothetical protein
VQRAYKARCNPATRLRTIPTTPTIRRTTPTDRTLRGAIIQTNPTFRRSQKIPMIVKRRQRVRRAVPTIQIPQADQTTLIRPADRTTPIPRVAQHPPRHQGRAVLAEQVERAAELNRITRDFRRCGKSLAHGTRSQRRKLPSVSVSQVQGRAERFTSRLAAPVFSAWDGWHSPDGTISRKAICTCRRGIGHDPANHELVRYSCNEGGRRVISQTAHVISQRLAGEER